MNVVIVKSSPITGDYAIIVVTSQGYLFSAVIIFLGNIAVLLLGVRALTDRRNAAPGGYVEPLALGALVWAIGLSLGGLTGYAINPARDLGPRLFTLAAGFRNTGFDSDAWWVPIVGPLVGGLLGALIYDALIRPFVPPIDKESA